MAERILIIDDEMSCRVLLAEYLRSYGFECEEASNGSDGLARALDEDWSLVLSDIMMPGLNGIELARLVRAFKSNVPVIMISAVRSSDMIQQAFREGVYDFIFKPFDLTELEMTVARALEKSRLTRENEEYKNTLEKMVAEQADKIRSLTLNSFVALARALEAKDQYTSGHSQRVGEYAALIAEEMQLDVATCERLRLAGQLHDIGKIGVSETVLNKPGRLSATEMELVQHHVMIGSEILTPLIADEGILKAVRHHHERMDGNGYPDNLVGEEIALEARIVAVADTFDAITTTRAYRPARDHEQALEVLKEVAGTQLDETVVAAFMRIEKEQLDDVMARYPHIKQSALAADLEFLAAEKAALVRAHC